MPESAQQCHIFLIIIIIISSLHFREMRLFVTVGTTKVKLPSLPFCSSYFQFQFDRLIEEMLSPAVLAYLSGQGFTNLTLQTGATARNTTDVSGGDLTVETYQYKPSLAEVSHSDWGRETDWEMCRISPVLTWSSLTREPEPV